MKRVREILLMAGGTLSVGMGVAGMFLPILPTTPFLLLAAFCYARSSKRFYDGLMKNRWFGEYIRNYREGRGLSLLHKTITLLLLWMTIGSTAMFAVSSWWVRGILLVIAAGVTVHLLRINTYKPPARVPGSAAPAKIACAYTPE